MKQQLPFLWFALLISCPAFSQVQVNKPISMTGTDADRKISNLAAPAVNTDAANVTSVQSGSLSYAAASGTNNYTLTINPVPAGYATGMIINFTVTNGNTAAVTIDVNNMGQKSVFKNVNNVLESGDITANQAVSVMYDGAAFQLLAGSLPKGSANYVQNKTANGVLSTGQTTSSFDVTGNSEVGGTMAVSNNMGIGTSTLNVTGSNANSRVLTIQGDGTGANTNGRIELANPKTTPAADDDAGRVMWVINNNAGTPLVAQALSALEGAGGASGFGARLSFWTKPNNVSSVVERMRIDNAGNVGIGTTNPLANLVVKGDANANETVVRIERNDGQRLFEFESNASGHGVMNIHEAGVGTRILLQANGNSYINTGGNLGIGINVGVAKLDVRQTSNGTAAYIRNDATAGTNYGVDGEAMGVGATTNIGGYFAASGATNNYAIIVPSGYGKVGIGTTAPGQMLSVVGTIESMSGGFKFPDGTTQTTALAVANFMGGLANGPTIITNNTGYASFTTVQNDDANIFETVATGNFGIKIKKAGTIMWNYDQDVITTSSTAYADLYALVNGVVVCRSIMKPTAGLWDGIHNGGSYTVPANAVLTFQYGSGIDITAMDNDLWGRLSIVWMGAK